MRLKVMKMKKGIVLFGLVFILVCIPVSVYSWEQPKAPKWGHNIEKLKQSGWWNHVQKDIREREYHVTYQEKGVIPGITPAYQAPNRAQNLRTYFRPQGIVVIPRTEETPSWKLELSLVGYGRGETKEVLKTPVINVDRAKIVYNRGGIKEWYQNRPEGLEQGFTIDHPLGGEGPLWIAINLAEGWTARSTHNGSYIELLDNAGIVRMHYGRLSAKDAKGHDVKAFLSAKGSSLGIKVEDRNAVYPLLIDPLLSTPYRGLELDQANAGFGWSVSTAGDVNGDRYSDVIVGALWYDNGEFDEGAAFVYHGSSQGLSPTAEWSADSDQRYANFGQSVSTAGDVNGDGYSDVIIGASVFDGAQKNDSGAAFVYHGSSQGLNQTPNWSAEFYQDRAYFGNSVSTAGDVNGDGYSDVIIGAPGYDHYRQDEGAAFVYHGSYQGLSSEPDWSIEFNERPANFGDSVSTAGDVNGDGYSDVIVAAPLYNGFGYPVDECGAVFVYHGSSQGLSTSPYGDWRNQGPQQPLAHFGKSVSTAGDVNGDGYSDIIVGAPGYDNGNKEDAGATFVYYGSSRGLSWDPDWGTEFDQEHAYFGKSVSTAGDVNGDGYADVIIGAPDYDYDQYEDAGAVFVYYGSSQGLSQTPTWSIEFDQNRPRFEHAYFGSSVSTAGDVNGDGYSDIIIGAYGYDNDQYNEGAAFVYRGSSTGLDLTPAWNTWADQPNARFGWSISTAGDVNGDGYADIIVGARQYDSGYGIAGMAFVYHGNPSGLSSEPDWYGLHPTKTHSMFGWSVSTAGDVNGDGYSDVIIGAPNSENVFIYHGSPSGLSLGPDWSIETDQRYTNFGSAVSTAGDVNGDGYSDVIIGAPYFYNGEIGEGVAFVYHGSPSGLPNRHSWMAESNQRNAHFGWSVSIAGDVNGDGFSDVIIGAPFYDHDQYKDAGKAFVYHGSSGGLSRNPDLIIELPFWKSGEPFFASSVSTAGDVNNDGYSDVIIGAPGYDGGITDQGAALVYYGSPAGLEQIISSIGYGERVDARFGSSVSTAGDVNGDGHSDVIVGAPGFWHSEINANEGAAFLYLSGWLWGPPSWSAESDQTEAHFGTAVSTAGDVNGDGYSDVIVGAEYRTNWTRDEGKVFLYYGNGGSGLPVIPRQLATDSSTPISYLGSSDARDHFYVSALGRSPMGRASVKLEWEVKPLGVSFDGSNTTISGNFMDTGTSGHTFIERADGLTSGTAYHWRARFRYRAGNPMGLVASRWFSPFPNGWQETDLKTKDAIPPVPPRFALTPFFGGFFFDDKLPVDDGVILGIRVNYNLTRNFSLEGELGVTPTDDVSDNGTVLLASGNLLYHILHSSQRFKPFLTAGLGTLIYRGFTSDDESFAFNFGGGIKVPLSNRLGLRIDIRDYLASSAFASGTTNNIQISGGNGV